MACATASTRRSLPAPRWPSNRPPAVQCMPTNHGENHMVINPVTVELGQHEWEHIMRVLKTSASHLDPVRSKARPALEHYLSTIEYAVAKAEEARGLSDAFREFWSHHQELPFGKAMAAFKAGQEVR